jgi:putative ABC transport system permease protein
MKFLASLRSLCSSLFHRKHIDSEMDEEMRLHIQNRADDLERSGFSRVDAERRARIEFGGVERFKEEVRETRWETHLDSLFRDFRYALRSLRKDRRFVGVAVFALALGIGASTVVFSVFYNLLFNAFAAKDAGRLVVPVIEDSETSGEAYSLWTSWADLKYLRERNHVFEDVIGFRTVRSIVQDGARMFQFDGAWVTADAFEFYGVPAFLGRGIVSEDGEAGAPKVFVLSYGTWKAEFGADPSIVGKSFVVNGEPRTLVGVMPQKFRALDPWKELFAPARWNPDAEKNEGSKFRLLARVKRGVTFAAASAEFDVLAKQLAAMHPKDDDYPKKFSARVVGANDYLMGPSGAGTVFNSKIQLKSILYDLLAAVLVLLLIACSNVANLLLARATAREKELAVRAALGASRRQIIWQLLTESLVLAMTACTAGCALAWVAMKAVDGAIHQKTWAGMSGEAAVGLNGPVLMFAGVVTLMTTLICGSAPALNATRRDLQAQLAGNGKGTGDGFRHGKVRGGLVIGQVALSIVLLIGAGLMMRSLHLLTHIDLGFNPKNILAAGFAPARSIDQMPDRAFIASPEGHARFERVVEKIRELPGVVSVAVDNTFPGYGPSNGPKVTVPGGTRVEMAGLDECDENCADTLGIRIVAGRWLSRDEVVTRQWATVLNQKLAHDMFGDENPVGKQLKVKDFDRWQNELQRSFRMKPEQIAPDATFEIVGVAGDVKNAGPQQPAMPMAFIPPMITGDFIVQVRTKVDPGLMMHTVQQAVWDVDRNEVFWIFDPLSEVLDQHTYATPEFGVTLSGPLAGIALLLVVIGVFSVMAYTVSLRTQEIGVRMALGAQRGEILRMVLRHGMVLIAAGICIGVLASFGLTRFLKSQIWGVSATDPWTFGAVAALVVITGLAACLLPARRAASVDPLVGLRYE